VDAYGSGFKSSCYWMTQFFPQFLKFLSLGLMKKSIVLWFELCCFCCLFRFAVDFYTHCCRALTLALARLSCTLNEQRENLHMRILVVVNKHFNSL